MVRTSLVGRRGRLTGSVVRWIRSAAVFLVVLLAGPAQAFALEQIRVGLMSLEAPEGNGRAIAVLAERSAQIFPRIESSLGMRATSRFRMVLIPVGTVEDPDLRRIDASVPWWAAGYTIPSLRLCVVRMSMAGRYPYGSIEAVLAHEATHLMLHDAGVRIPLWFEEGIATAEGRRFEFRDMLAFSGSLLTADLPRLADLDSSFHASAAEAQLAYAGSHAFVARTTRDHGPAVVRDILRASREVPFDVAWERVTGASLVEAESAWRRTSLIRYRWIPLLTASSTLWIAIMFLSIVAGARKRAVAQRTRERWAKEEREYEAIEAEAAREGSPLPWNRAEPAEDPAATPDDAIEDMAPDRSRGPAPDPPGIRPIDR